jgi:hypothetical protein
MMMPAPAPMQLFRHRCRPHCTITPPAGSAAGNVADAVNPSRAALRSGGPYTHRPIASLPLLSRCAAGPYDTHVPDVCRSHRRSVVALAVLSPDRQCTLPEQATAWYHWLPCVLPGLIAAEALRQQVRGLYGPATPVRRLPAPLCNRGGAWCRPWTATAAGAFRHTGGDTEKLR